MRRIDSVLVIDDDPLTRETLELLLNAAGAANVSSTPSAENALQRLSQKPFSFVVCDYRLEGMNGVEFVEELRRQGDRTPVLLLSGAPDRAGVFRIGCQERVEFYPKPIQFRDFVAAINHLLTSRGNSRSKISTMRSAA